VHTISEVWQRIRAHQSEQFETITGLPFTYTVSGNMLVTDRTDSQLHLGEFEKALALVPLDGPGKISMLVRGPSYIWAILHDPRIRRTDW
jgi:hypothetical protein